MPDFIIQTPHGSISVREAGTGKIPVLFLHGNSSCKDVFRHQMDHVAFHERFRLISIDLPGHGASENAKNPHDTYTQPAYAEVAKTVLEQLEATDAIVVGWSLGGHIGIELTQILPQMRALAISGTPPCGPGIKSVNAAFTPLPQMSFTSKEVFNDEDAKTYARYTCGLDLPVDQSLLLAVKRTDGVARNIMWNRWTEDNLGCDQKAVIAKWNKPIAIIQGDNEAFFENGYFETLVFSNLWNGGVQIISGGGHAPFWAKPERYNQLLLEFLTDVGM